MAATPLSAALEKCRRKKRLSKIYCRLERYGDPDAILKEAREELDGKCIFERSDLALTPKYLIDLSPRVKAVIPLVSALWVFRLQDMRYSLKEQRDVMHYSMRIYTITGDTFVLKNREKKEFDKIEEVLTERYPNFFYGYSEEQDRMVHYILEEQARELRESRKKSGK